MELSVRTVYVLLTLSVLLTGACGYTGRVLLISMDGFRWDYLNTIHNLTNFQKFASEGVRSEYINNTFITVTFASHYSIATGLYEESHGVIANYMYDPVFNATFRPGNNEGRWWDGGEPVWITATRNNVPAGTYYWPGSEVELKGVRPKYSMPYNSSVPFKQRIDTVIDWFKSQSVRLATLYINEPDKTGHVYGPGTPQVIRKVKEMDDHLGYLMESVKEANLEKVLNIILLSDHGMVSVKRERIVDLSEALDPDLIQIIPYAKATCHIQPKPGKGEEVYENLRRTQPRMSVYRKQDIPEHWHYKNHRRITDILGVMDEGWRCLKKKTDYNLAEKGTHGYDNRLMSMKPIFLARGPDFKRNHRAAAGSIRSIDMYPLMCELLGIPPAPNNGSLDNTRDILQQTTAAAPYRQGACALTLAALSLVPRVIR